MDNKQIIIDAHAHIYPEKIAAKAPSNIYKFYEFKEVEGANGSPQALINAYGKVGIKKAVVHSTATVKKQVKSINDFISQTIKTYTDFTGFATLHPDMTIEELASEIERFKELGLKGVKLHPDFQRFDIDGGRAQTIYRVLGNTYPILIHVGDPRYDFSNPLRLEKMAAMFPDTLFIAPHLGGYTHWDKVEIFKDHKNVVFDTCSALPFLDKEQAVRIIETLGEDRFMFGTDFPIWKPNEELDRFFALPLTDSQKDKILHKNAERILGL